MNMLIIGNGFDLAHGRPTKYEDFLKFTEQIWRTKTYCSTKEQFEETMPSLHTEVKKYIFSAFETRAGSMRTAVYNKNSIIQEMYDCLEENVWNDYFQIIVKENQILGKNWIDFEIEIREIIKFFDEKFNDLYDPLPPLLKDFGSFNSKISAFWSKLKFSKYNKLKNKAENYKNTCFDFIEKTYQDLESLIRCLEIYLDDCVGKMIVPCFSPDITNLGIDSVLSFNYTAIPVDFTDPTNPTIIYPSLTNIHHIHGRAKANCPAFENNMVLGVNEYWEGKDEDTHTNFNLYKKFVQRIIKETGIGYKTTLKCMRSDYEDSIKYRTLDRSKPQYNHVYIFGHSLDVTDGDILREIIRTKGVVTTIFYRNKQQQADQIANLSKVLTQDELLERTLSTFPTIIFKQQADMVLMQADSTNALLAKASVATM